MSKNYAVVDVEDAGTYPFTLNVTHGFTATQGGVLIVAIAFVVVNLITDLLYAFVDPRIKYS